jgi:ubiquinone biosynthesis protein UbiJ
VSPQTPAEISELTLLGLEQALNAALAADPVAQDSLHELAGKRIRIQLKGVLNFDLLPLNSGTHPHITLATPGLDAPDASLIASPLGFLRAKMRGNLMHGDIELQGDSHTSVRTARLLSGLRPDIERALTPHLGGLLAHQIARLWHGLGAKLRRFSQHRLLDKADFLHDEIQLAPRRADLEPWYDDVDRLRNRLDALEARVHTFETRHAGHLDEACS